MTDRDRILARNVELQKNPDAIRTLSFGRSELSIPFEDMARLEARHPELTEGRESRDAFWRKFIRSTESIPYRVR